MRVLCEKVSRRLWHAFDDSHIVGAGNTADNAMRDLQRQKNRIVKRHRDAERMNNRIAKYCTIARY